MSGNKRGPKPALTVEQIARAAIGIADTEGLAAVTMQRVTASLGFTKMAVYRYVSGRAELIAHMTEVAAGEPPSLGTAGWREGLKRWAAALLEMFTSHPWLLESTIGPRLIGPRELGWLERAIRALDQTALEGNEKIDVAVTLTGHVRMIAQQSRGSTEMQVPGDDFPALIAAMRGGPPPDRAYDIGLECILDGIEAMHIKRSAR